MSRIVMVLALACAASPGDAHKVRVDFDHTATFGHYKTYRLVQPAQAGASSFPNQLMQERIAGCIEEALAARGLKRTDGAEDLQITYRIEVTEQPQYTTFIDGGGPGWWGWNGGWGGGTGFATTTVQTTYEGALVIDIMDAHQKRLVFQGISTHTIRSRPEKNTKTLTKAVSEVFEKFPPRP